VPRADEGLSDDDISEVQDGDGADGEEALGAAAGEADLTRVLSATDVADLAMKQVFRGL